MPFTETSGQTRRVFITGGTGYLGRSLIPVLAERGHTAHALVRDGSEHKLPPGCREISVGNALDNRSYETKVRSSDTFVHLVGVSHPAPWKARLFEEIDLASVRASIAAAQRAKVGHFVYVSVAHPAPVMKAYIAIRLQCEALIRESGLTATILRPWYVLGPGHHWPRLLLPLYWVLGQLPTTRDIAQRLGLVTLPQMTHALLWAIERPPTGIEILTVSHIRQMGR